MIEDEIRWDCRGDPENPHVGRVFSNRLVSDYSIEGCEAIEESLKSKRVGGS